MTNWRLQSWENWGQGPETNSVRLFNKCSLRNIKWFCVFIYCLGINTRKVVSHLRKTVTNFPYFLKFCGYALITYFIPRLKTNDVKFQNVLLGLPWDPPYTCTFSGNSLQLMSLSYTLILSLFELKNFIDGLVNLKSFSFFTVEPLASRASGAT